MIDRTQAEKLKLVGFDLPTNLYYKILTPNSFELKEPKFCSNRNSYADCLSVVEVSVALEWLRKHKQIRYMILFGRNGDYFTPVIFQNLNGIITCNEELYPDQESLERMILDKVLDYFIKEKKDA